MRVHAVGDRPTERLKLRRQTAAAAGKKSATSLSLFMESYGLEVEEERSPPWLLSTGQKEYGQEMELRAKRSLDEADSRGSNVETGKRTSRSSDV